MGTAEAQLATSGPTPVEVLAPEVRAPQAARAPDLAELIAAFNQVTTNLQRSHEKLHGEVSRLRAELHEASVQIERSRRLAALGEMAAGIAHEVRNPLGSIRLYARMLEQDLAERSVDREIAVKIGRSVAEIEGIVGDVLSFAREYRLNWGEVEAWGAMERALEAACPEQDPLWRQVGVARDGPREPLGFDADASLVQQALLNLVRNALQAMEDHPAPGSGHRLVLAVTRRDLVVGERRVPGVSLAVRDSGRGVSEEVVARMFNPFFTTRHTGTGLGLAIVHRIMDAHGGRVEVRNNRETAGAAGEEPGACAELIFPLRREALERAREGPHTTGARHEAARQEQA